MSETTFLILHRKSANEPYVKEAVKIPFFSDPIASLTRILYSASDTIHGNQQSLEQIFILAL